MENKVNLKRCLGQIAVLVMVFLFGIAALNYFEYRRYMTNYNQKLNQILAEVKETYPDVSEAELVEILNQSAMEEKDGNWLESFGIDLKEDSMILQNEKDLPGFQGMFVIWCLLSLLAVVVVFLRYNQKKDEELAKITKYIEEINHKNYKLEIDDMSEDELSILKTEIYKTTVMLKEVAEHSMKAKNDLKESLSDISHQLKTPLTSISIILDNLTDDPDMPQEVRQDFLYDAKREIRNINFLVQSLLKLSKLDADSVVFKKEEMDANVLVNTAVKNVTMLCDLKNVEVEISGSESKNSTILGDFHWQVEALTNILKNCVEHSPENQKVMVELTGNKVYTAIAIRDFGEGMDAEDQNHIFERFYKGKNASDDSVGIGLALAKAIVERDRGHITVESGNWGTRFTVKYFRM